MQRRSCRTQGSREDLIVITDGEPDNPTNVQLLVRRLAHAGSSASVSASMRRRVRTVPDWVSVNALDELAPKLFNLMGHQLTRRRVA